MERFLKHGHPVRSTSVEAVRQLGQSIHTAQPKIADLLKRYGERRPEVSPLENPSTSNFSTSEAQGYSDDI